MKVQGAIHYILNKLKILDDEATSLVTMQTVNTSGFTGNAMESSFTVTERPGYAPIIVGMKPNNYNAAHYISYYSPPSSTGVVYYEHNLNSNATFINVYIMWVRV